MEPTQVIKAATDAGLAPSVQMVLVIIALLFLISGPVMLFLRDYKKREKVDEIEGKQGEIQTGLYTHLYEQITFLTRRLDTLQIEHNTMVQENAELRSRVSALVENEKTVTRLQTKLNEKDAVILSRDTQINQLFSELRLRDQKIIELQERLNILEIRVARDERTFINQNPPKD